MVENNRTYYECEYCGKISESYEEIEECEKTCKSISAELENIIESCNKLNKLGCTIELRDFPYYDNNKLDLAVGRRLSKDYKLVFKANDDIGRIDDNINILLCDSRSKED